MPNTTKLHNTKKGNMGVNLMIAIGLGLLILIIISLTSGKSFGAFWGSTFGGCPGQCREICNADEYDQGSRGCDKKIAGTEIAPVKYCCVPFDKKAPATNAGSSSSSGSDLFSVVAIDINMQFLRTQISLDPELAHCELKANTDNPAHISGVKYYECSPGFIPFIVSVKNKQSQQITVYPALKYSATCPTPLHCNSYTTPDSDAYTCAIGSGATVLCETNDEYKFSTPGFYVVVPGAKNASANAVVVYNTTKYIEIMIINSTDCTNKPEGTKCNPASDVMTLSVCNATQQCVSTCEYCAQYPNKDICTGKLAVSNILVVFNSTFSCGCERAQCFGDNKDNCLTGFCPITNPDTYCCSG